MGRGNETQGFCLRWTPWRVFIHPFRACRQLADAAATETDISNRLSETLHLLEEQRKESAHLTTQSADFCRQLANTEATLSRERNTLQETQRELGELRKELSEHKKIDEKLQAFDRELRKAEEMKRKYEKRIAELESRLASARRRLSEANDNELIEPIDMTNSSHIPKPSGYNAQPTLERRHRPSVGRKDDVKKPAKAQAEEKANRDDDDWLLELPDF